MRMGFGLIALLLALAIAAVLAKKQLGATRVAVPPVLQPAADPGVGPHGACAKPAGAAAGARAGRGPDAANAAKSGRFSVKSGCCRRQ